MDRISIAAQLEEIAAASGDSLIRRAAAFLRAPGGRPACDDDAALAEVERLIAAGVRPTRAYRQAARRLAASSGAEASIPSIAKRLSRKRLNRERDSQKQGTKPFLPGAEKS